MAKQVVVQPLLRENASIRGRENDVSFNYSFVLHCRGGGSLCNFWNFSPSIAFYNDPPFYQNVKVRPTPHFITNPAILGFSKFLRKQKSFSARQNSFREQKLIYIFTNCMFAEKKQNFFNLELERQIQICYHTIKLHCRVFCSKFMCESKHPPLALHLISTPPHFKDLFMIFPVGHLIMTPLL